jgi:hypothetical protein
MGVESLFGQLSGRQYIGGELRAARGDRYADIIDPATEQVIGRYTDATAAEVDEAVRISNVAQKRWHKVNYHRRAEMLHEVAQAMRQDRPVVAEMLTREMGKTYKESADEVSWAKCSGPLSMGSFTLRSRSRSASLSSSCRSTIRCVCCAGRQPRRSAAATPSSSSPRS